MNCTSCGAAMELVESCRYFRCGHCGRYHFPDRVEADGIDITGRCGDAVACPLCAVPMANATLHGEPIHFCETCRGMLLPRAAFAELIFRQRASPSSPPTIPPPLDRRALNRELSCPRCARRFDTHAYGGPGNAVVDGCAQCDVMWLDFGEFRQIIDAPGRDRGRPVSANR
jgi:Zn-finger nucleic acid-binding protein